METTRKVQIFQEKAASLSELGHSRRRGEIGSDTCSLLFQQLLAKCLSLPGEICEDDGAVVKTSILDIHIQVCSKPIFESAEAFSDLPHPLFVFRRD